MIVDTLVILRLIFDIIDAIYDSLSYRINNNYNISETALLRHYDKFKENKFGYVYGYTNVILAFSKLILLQSLPAVKKICPSLKLCIITAEICSEEHKKTIEQALGIQPVKQRRSI